MSLWPSVIHRDQVPQDSYRVLANVKPIGKIEVN